MSMPRIFREDYTWLSEIVKWKRIARALEFQFGTQKKWQTKMPLKKKNQHSRALQNCAVYNKILIIGIVESFGNTVFMTFLLESNVKWLSWFVLSTSTTKCSGMVKYHSNQKPRDINHADDPKSYSLKLWFWIMRVRIQCRTLVFTFSQSAYHPICWPVIFKWSKSNFQTKDSI